MLRQVGAWIVPEHALVSRRALRYVAVITVMVVVVAGAALTVTDAEHFDSIWDGLWWASTTVTTVGYGDIVPHTAIGRVVAVIVMFAGIGLVSVLTASLASALLAEDVEGEELHIDRELTSIMEALRRIEARLDAIDGSTPEGSSEPSERR